MALITRLTALLGIEHPIILAPMEAVSGGRLAGAVSRAGGLGLVAGGYGDYEWLAREFALAEGARVGCGFINWALAKDATALHTALERLGPVAVMLSFGDPEPFADPVRESGAILMIQVQTLDEARHALEVGADVVIAQGTEAGGHGTRNRSTMPLIPAVVDLVGARSPQTPVVAAGGVADGRGVAAALALGADGVLMGTRFWATAEALVPDQARARVIEATGEETLRTTVDDRANGHDWPTPYTNRVLRNGFTDKWHGAEAAMNADLGAIRERYRSALTEHDFDTAAVPGGQSMGLIRDVPPAGEILTAMVAEAEATVARLTAMRR